MYINNDNIKNGAILSDLIIKMEEKRYQYFSRHKKELYSIIRLNFLNSVNEFSYEYVSSLSDILEFMEDNFYHKYYNYFYVLKVVNSELIIEFTELRK